jgi:histidinol-phosphate aminotransferase
MKFRRDILKDVQGYTPGEQPQGGPIIKLNTNENPYPPSPKVLEAVRNLDAESLRKYPDPVSTKLRAACAERYGFDGPEWVIAGNGMDEILALTIRTFVDPGQKIVVPYPNYSLYEVLIQLHGAELEYIDMAADFQLPEGLFGSDAPLCFVTRPNAPTGVMATKESMERLCESFQGIVFIDEAYVDFADESCIDFPKRYDNVIVGRTFSKSFGLCGVRLGLGISNPDIIAEFMKTKDSYNLNVSTQAAGIAAIEDYDYMLDTVGKIKQTRARLESALKEMGFTFQQSHTNFILPHWNGAPTAKEIFEQLKAQRILIRYFDSPGLTDALRISVGTEDETDSLLKALAEIVHS